MVRSKPKPISLQRQKELLKIYGNDKPFGVDYIEGKITDDENYFMLVTRILKSKYAKPMSMYDFVNIINP